MWDSCDISFKAMRRRQKFKSIHFLRQLGDFYLKFLIKSIFLFLLGRSFTESRQKNEEKVKNVKIVIFDIYEGKGTTETSQ